MYIFIQMYIYVCMYICIYIYLMHMYNWGCILQLMDVVEELFVTMFDNLNETCQEELNMIKSLYPFESLQVNFSFMVFTLVLYFQSLYMYT